MNKNNIAIPLAIVAAGVLIAGAVYFKGEKPATPAKQEPQKTAEIKPVDEKTDHVLGNPNAKIKIVEYSDIQCPFCQLFHPTLQKVMETYGKDGQVAWVYRHFPLNQIHPYAQKAAEGSECAAELGGNTKFWAFIDDIFADKDTQASKLTDLTAVAKRIGLDGTKFKSCVDSGKYASKVAESLQEGIDIGVRGTPTSFIVVDGKVEGVISDAGTSFETMKKGLDAILK